MGPPLEVGVLTLGSGTNLGSGTTLEGGSGGWIWTGNGVRESWRWDRVRCWRRQVRGQNPVGEEVADL